MTDSKVVPFAKKKSAEQKDLIETLEMLLVRAQRGDLDKFAFVCVEKDNCIGTGMYPGEDGYAGELMLVGALEQLQHDVLSRREEDDLAVRGRKEVHAKRRLTPPEE